MKLITLYLPEPMLEALNTLIERKVYSNRAEALRIACRDLLLNHNLWQGKAYKRTLKKELASVRFERAVEKTDRKDRKKLEAKTRIEKFRY